MIITIIEIGVEILVSGNDGRKLRHLKGFYEYYLEGAG